jgi:threonine aldolase
MEPDGTLDIQKISSYIKPKDNHFANTALICIENTHSGVALPLNYNQLICSFAKNKKLKLHLDGARIFNASVYDKVEIKSITKYYDSVSICFSKGLGTPVGSILCGERDFIKAARRWRKVAGGGMRQSGILAAACIYALENNINRLEEDHQNAKLLAEKLREIKFLKVDFHKRQTNMVFIHFDEKFLPQIKDFFRKNNILISFDKKTRLVTHLNVGREDILKVIEIFKTFFAEFE